MRYVPDFNNEKYKPSQILERKFLFELINTLDPQFFLDVIHEVEEHKRPIMKPKPAEQVEVCEDLAELIEYGVAGRRTSGGLRLLGSLKKGAKKRAAPVRKPVYKIMAKINPNA